MNKNKIFTSAKKVFKSREGLEQEEVLDIEQQDIAQEIEQLRAEIKAFYLEHPDKDPSMPDKIYVKDMNELEEKITEHIPKKVVEDEIVIKNIVEQDGPGGASPLDFSRMKEYDLPDEYRSQVFSPNIADDETKQEKDSVTDYINKKSDTDTVKELFGEELSRDMQSADREKTSEVEDVDIKEVQVDLSLLKESLDQDLLQQLQEQRIENEQDEELKNKIFTHQGIDKSNNYSIADEASRENSNQEENVKLQNQDNDDTKNMSDLLSKLLSEGKLEADLHNEDNQEGSADLYIPGMNVEYEEEKDIEGDGIDIPNPDKGENLLKRNEEETRDSHDSNLSDLLSDLLSKDQDNADKDQTVDKGLDTEDYHNRVFISSVKAAKKLPGLEEQSMEANRKGEMKEDYKSDEKVIFQEYGGYDEQAIEINIDNLIKDDSDMKNQECNIKKPLHQQENSDEDKVSILEGTENEQNKSFDYAGKRIIEAEKKEFAENDKGNVENNIENILNSLLDDSENDVEKDTDKDEKDILTRVMESTDDLEYVKETELKDVKDQEAVVPIENKGMLLNEAPLEKQDNIENILDSLMHVTGSDSTEIQENGALTKDSLKLTEQEDETMIPGIQDRMQKKKDDPVASVLPEKKKTNANKIPENKNDADNKKIAAELVKSDHSIHAVKVLTEEKRQSLLARLLQKIKNMFRKKPKMEIISQEAAIDESNVYKSQEKETFINGLITGSVSGDNVTLNPLAVVKKDVIAQGKVLCLSGAAIMGKVDCESIIVEGTVFGEIEARGKVIIKNDALVLGNIYSSDVRITQGAMVQGDIFFKNPERKGK